MVAATLGRRIRDKCASLLFAVLRVDSGCDPTKESDLAVSVRIAESVARSIQIWIPVDPPPQVDPAAVPRSLDHSIDKVGELYDLLSGREHTTKRDVRAQVDALFEGLTRARVRWREATHEELLEGDFIVVDTVLDWYHDIFNPEYQMLAHEILSVVWEWLHQHVVPRWGNLQNPEQEADPDDVGSRALLNQCLQRVQDKVQEGRSCSGNAGGILRDIYEDIYAVLPCLEELEEVQEAADASSEATSLGSLRTGTSRMLPTTLSSLGVDESTYSLLEVSTADLRPNAAALSCWEADVQEVLSAHGPLHQAAVDGNLPRLKALVRRSKGEFAGPDSNGDTPLTLAAFFGHMDLVRYLIDARIDREACDLQGRSALYQASMRGHAEVVEFLLKRAADPGKCDLQKRTPLMEASRFGHADVVQLLLPHAKCNIDARDSEGKTAIELAASEGHLNVVRLLASSEAMGSAEQSALQLAQENGHSEVAEFLELLEARWKACCGESKLWADLCSMRQLIESDDTSYEDLLETLPASPLSIGPAWDLERAWDDEEEQENEKDDSDELGQGVWLGGHSADEDDEEVDLLEFWQPRRSKQRVVGQ